MRVLAFNSFFVQFCIYFFPGLGKSYCSCVKQTFEASRAALCPPIARQ